MPKLGQESTLSESVWVVLGRGGSLHLRQICQKLRLPRQSLDLNTCEQGSGPIFERVGPSKPLLVDLRVQILLGINQIQGTKGRCSELSCWTSSSERAALEALGDEVADRRPGSRIGVKTWALTGGSHGGGPALKVPEDTGGIRWDIPLCCKNRFVGPRE